MSDRREPTGYEPGIGGHDDSTSGLEPSLSIDKLVMEFIIELNQPDPQFHISAARNWQRNAGPLARQRLIAVLAGGSQKERRVITAFGQAALADPDLGVYFSDLLIDVVLAVPNAFHRLQTPGDSILHTIETVLYTLGQSHRGIYSSIAPRLIALLAEVTERPAVSSYPEYGYGAIGWIMALIGGPRAIAPLLDMLGDVSGNAWAWRPREAAAYALGYASRQLGNVNVALVLEALDHALDDSAPLVRYAATSSLGVIGLLDAIPLLKKAQKDVAPNVREMSLWAMASISGQETYGDLLTALDDKAPNVVEMAATILGQLPSDEAVPHLTRVLFTRSSPNYSQIKGRAGMVNPKPFLTALERLGTKQALSAIETWRGEQAEEAEE